MQRFTRLVKDGFGNPASGAQAYVTDSASGAAVTLYSATENNLTPVGTISNPVVAGPDGIISFAAPNGRYTIVFSGSNITAWSEPWVTLNDSFQNAPISAGYLTVSADPTLTAERVLTAGSNIALSDGGANTTLTVSVSATPSFTSATLTNPLAVASGGTGLAALGTANQIPGVNAGGTALEYKTVQGTANQVTVTNAAGSVTLATPQNIHTGASPTFAGGTYTGPVSITGSADVVQLQVKGNAAQTANIRETRNSANVLLESLSNAGAYTVATISVTGLTSGRVPFAGAGGLLGDNANFTYIAGTGLRVSDATASNSPTTGALVVAGGVGIGGSSFIGGNLGVGTSADGQGHYIQIFGNTIPDRAPFLSFFRSGSREFIQGIASNGLFIFANTGGGIGYTDAALIAAANLCITSLGKIGINTTAPSAVLEVLGDIKSTSPTAGIGYGTGAGGAVTQLTSRTTGVTINNVCGAITLVSAAGSATWQTFTVTNSAVAATDVVCVCQKSGTDLYEIHVTAVAAGSFNVSFRTTGGTTTEQPVFNFSVIKAVTA